MISFKNLSYDSIKNVVAKDFVCVQNIPNHPLILLVLYLIIVISFGTLFYYGIMCFWAYFFSFTQT